MTMLDIASYLKVNGALNGGRETSRWFALPSRSFKLRRWAGYDPSIIIESVRDLSSDSRQYASRAVRVGGFDLY